MLNDKEMAEFLKGISPYKLYIINADNKIEVLICPFEATSKIDVAFIKKHQRVLVELVKITRTLKTVFIIEGQAFFAINFNI